MIRLADASDEASKDNVQRGGHYGDKNTRQADQEPDAKRRDLDLHIIPLITWPHSQQSNDMTPTINLNAFMDLENDFIDLKNSCMY